MIRIAIAAALMLGACSCSPAPSKTARHDIEGLLVDYAAALHRENVYARLPPCASAPPPCMSPALNAMVTTYNYAASNALLRAQSQQDTGAIAKARVQVDAFTQATKQLSVP